MDIYPSSLQGQVIRGEFFDICAHSISCFVSADDMESSKSCKSLNKSKCTVDTDPICNDVQVKKQQVSSSNDLVARVSNRGDSLHSSLIISLSLSHGKSHLKQNLQNFHCHAPDL